MGCTNGFSCFYCTFCVIFSLCQSVCVYPFLYSLCIYVRQSLSKGLSISPLPSFTFFVEEVQCIRTHRHLFQREYVVWLFDLLLLLFLVFIIFIWCRKHPWRTQTYYLLCCKAISSKTINYHKHLQLGQILQLKITHTRWPAVKRFGSEMRQHSSSCLFVFVYSNSFTSIRHSTHQHREKTHAHVSYGSYVQMKKKCMCVGQRTKEQGTFPMKCPIGVCTCISLCLPCICCDFYDAHH